MARLSLHLFGQFQAYLDGTPVIGFNSDKTRALLAYLAVESNRAHRRESLAGLFWPDVLESSARQSLSQALSTLRKLLRDGEAGLPFILVDRETIQFNPNSDYELDVRQLEALAGRSSETVDAERVLTLYRSPLLEGFSIANADGFEEWLLLRRESLQRAALSAFDKVVTAALHRSDFAKAIALARRQLELDPWREETHRDLMRAYALNGQRADALSQYEKCRQILRESLGIEPSAETKALWSQIQKEELHPFSEPVSLAETNRPVAAGLIQPQALPALPVSATPFVGREAELAELASLIANSDVRLITLMGAGGAGKTRLALQAAAQAQGRFEFGAAFVPLVSVSSSEQIVPAIATALNVPLRGDADDRVRLLNLLREKSVLLILDNFEHLLGSPGSVEMVTELLYVAPQVKLLVTSREALNIGSEWVRDVSGLGQDAYALFVQSARRVYAQATLTPEDDSAINRICKLVEGMPLGVELAASWTRLLSCADIADEIARNIDFLATTTRDVPARHRSITAVFDYSWKLLTAREQQVMQQLSVFRSGFTREAAKQVAGASLLELSALISKSLVRRASSGRYDLHELVRQFAAQRLAEADRAEQTRDRHLDYFATLAEKAESLLLGTEQAAWLTHLEADLDNIHAALDWAWQPDADTARITKALRIMAALRDLWRVHGHLSEARNGLGRLISRVVDVPAALRAKSLGVAGLLALWQDDLAVARSLLNQSLHIWQQNESPASAVGIAHVLLGLGEVAIGTSDYTLARLRYEESYAIFEKASDKWGMSEALLGLARQVLEANEIARKRALLERSYAMKREIGDTRGTAWVLSWMSAVAHQAGDLEQARMLNLECLTFQQALGDKLGIALTLNRIAEVLRHEKDFAQASAYYAESLQRYRELGSTRGTAMVLHNMGHIALTQGNIDRARAYFKESLVLYDQQGDKEGIALCLAGFGALALAMGRPKLAVQRLAAAATTMNQIGYFFEASDNEAYKRNVAAARTQLTPAEFNVAWAEGDARPLNEMAAEALS